MAHQQNCAPPVYCPQIAPIRQVTGGAHVQLCATTIFTTGGAQMEVCATSILPLFSCMLQVTGGAQLYLCATSKELSGGAPLYLCATGNLIFLPYYRGFSLSHTAHTRISPHSG